MASSELLKIKQRLLELDEKIGLRLDEFDVIIRRRVTPFLAIMQADFKSLIKTKITYAWLIAGIFLQALRVISMPAVVGTSFTIVTGFADFIYIWSLFIIATTASAVSSESGELADSIMSKSVKRYDYILAKFSSRISYVMVIFLTITAVLVGSSIRMLDNNHEVIGLFSTILFIALIVTMLTALGVAISTLTSSTVISIISLLGIWYSMVFFFPMWDLGLIAPTELLILLEDVIQNIWMGEEWIPATVYLSITTLSVIVATVYFSLKDL